MHLSSSSFFSMSNLKRIEWVLRVAIFGEFLGHGVFALQGKPAWIGWIQQLLPVSAEVAGTLLTIIGILDVTVAIVVLVRPLRPVLGWALAWGFWTALLRPIVGEPIWDFVERWANWGAPLALYILLSSEPRTKH
jgi:hypothetical protein